MDSPVFQQLVACGDLRALRDCQFIRVRADDRIAITDDFGTDRLGVTAGSEPLCTVEAGGIAAVVVGQRTERQQARLARKHFMAIAGEGDESSLCLG